MNGVVKSHTFVFECSPCDPDGYMSVTASIYGQCALDSTARQDVHIVIVAEFPLKREPLSWLGHVRVIFKSGRTLRSVLTKVKDTLLAEKQSKVVYQIPCSCGKTYIGETTRRLETRMKEHQDACCRGMLEKSVVAEHAWEHHHPIHWGGTKVINRANRPKKFKLKEALHIQMSTEELLNRDIGLEAPSCWLATLK